MRNFVLAFLTLTLSLPIFAVDGVLEINQTCAVNTGCFSGDAAGFPVTIDGSAGLSYVLTANAASSLPRGRGAAGPSPGTRTPRSRLTTTPSGAAMTTTATRYSGSLGKCPPTSWLAWSHTTSHTTR